MLRRPLVLLCTVLAAVLTGCATTDLPLATSLTEFSNGIDALIRPGMPWKEAHRIIRERFPRPRWDTESAALVFQQGNAGRNRRFTLVWDTTEPGTSLVLTVECDRQLRVARWSVGPLNESR